MQRFIRPIISAGAVTAVFIGLLAAACSESHAAERQPGVANPAAYQAAHPGPAMDHQPQAKVKQTEAEVAFHDAMRKLWEDHITWTRMFIVSDVANLPDTETAANRLLQNQADIGNAIKPYYGDAAGAQLTELLREHILIAAEILDRAKAGDREGTNSAVERWYANADEIAGFLHSANPSNWPLADLQQMMKTHLDLTLEEAQARLGGNWAADVAAYDKVHAEILEMADMLSDGIIAQFPKQFK